METEKERNSGKSLRDDKYLDTHEAKSRGQIDIDDARVEDRYTELPDKNTYKIAALFNKTFLPSFLDCFSYKREINHASL